MAVRGWFPWNRPLTAAVSAAAVNCGRDLQLVRR